MKLRTTHKAYLTVLLSITAVVLCTLPFLLIKKDTIYVYTQNQYQNSKEEGFINGLKKSGYRVIVNANVDTSQKVALWFRPTNAVKSIMDTTKFKYNFIYNEDYYYFNWQELKEKPIMLTPYQDLYEHYMRSNIKSAKFYLGVNTKDYYPTQDTKSSIVYYEQRNQSTELKNYLSNLQNIQFVGRFWGNNVAHNAPLKDIIKKENIALSKAKFVIIDNNYYSKIIPEELTNAISSGSLVILRKSDEVYNMYKENLIYYNHPSEIPELIHYYNIKYDEVKHKINKARQITIENLSSDASVKRFIELLNWLEY